MRRLTATLLAAVLAVGLGSGIASAETLEPADWPPGLGLGSAPNAIRFGGIDRYHTALAMAYALQGGGSFPFDTPDRTAGAVWGAGTCPKSIIVVAGDTPADALAAAPLSDALNRSDEPRMTRVAAADPFFDPIGGVDRVDTDAAPIIVTTSGRSGARGFAAPARAAALELRSGRCTRAREAIIVGGEAAVPVEVEAELVGLGYEEVFRVGGVDRFDTAAQVARALGTEPAPAGADCDDERSDDGSTATGFYGNSVIEFRPDAASCELHGRTVVLAEGEMGADALAAGWWTSLWQVPVLLVRGDGSLPPPTREALASLAIDTIVVLGGTGRVPEAVVDEAARIAGAVVGRFGGVDRYETSVVMARVFGGWHPTGDAEDFGGDRVCLASSSGMSSGWPDALAAGPLCGVLARVGAVRRTPTRMLEPVEDATGTIDPPEPPHTTAPVLLVPAGALTPSGPVAGLLEAAFPAGADSCRGAPTPGCDAPGFAVAFGGSSAVSDGLLDEVSSLLSGGDDDQRGAQPMLGEPFRTTLDLTPVFEGAVDLSVPRGCADRASVQHARWLAAYAAPSLAVLVSSVDLSAEGGYAASVSTPRCVSLGSGTSAVLVAVSVAGRLSRVHSLRGDPDRIVSMSDSMRHGGPITASGSPGGSTEPGDRTSWRFRDAPSGPLDVRDGTSVTQVREAAADLFLTRGAPGQPATFVAGITVDDGRDGLLGSVTGEALLVGTSTWELAGRFRLPGASGGFRATLRTNGTPDNRDDLLEWRIDAVRP